MTQELTTIHNMSIGEIANIYAANTAFNTYKSRKAENTLRRQLADLALFSQFLATVHMDVSPTALQETPGAWANITHGLVAAFVGYMLVQGYAIGSINVRLSTIKKYSGLAATAGSISANEIGLIKLVQGFQHKEGRNEDAKRERTRVGSKKAEPVLISYEQAQALKAQPDTAHGRRDAFLMCLLLDHGLRCGEVADLGAASINIAQGTLTFYRKKVDKTQTHELTRDTLMAAIRYFEVRPADTDYLLAGSRKGGKLQGRMSERAITDRAKVLSEAIGVTGASAHDGRHAWATFAVRGGTDLKTLQDAGGWNSLAMPARYAASQKIANKGVKLGA